MLVGAKFIKSQPCPTSILCKVVVSKVSGRGEEFEEY